MKRSCNLLLGSLLMLGLLAGCGDTAEKLKQQGRDAADTAREKAAEVSWERILDEFDEAGLNARELGRLFQEHRWDEAKAWIERIDNERTRAVLHTVGEVLRCEEVDGVEGCSTWIEGTLATPDLAPERRRTLEIMQRYVTGKLGLKTSEVAVLIAVACLAHHGGGSLQMHGGEMRLDVLLLLKALDDFRASFQRSSGANEPTAGHPSAEANPARVPADVVAVVVANHGRHRVVVAEQGFEWITHDVQLQWLSDPAAPGGERSVDAVAPVTELSSGFWRIDQPRFVSTSQLQFTAWFRHLERPHPVTITFLAPGEFRFEGDLSIRADEL